MQEEPTLDALNTLIEEGDNIQVDHMKDVLQLVKPAKKAKAAPKKKTPEPHVVPVDPPLDGTNVEANAQATEQEGNADGDNEAAADEPGETMQTMLLRMVRRTQMCRWQMPRSEWWLPCLGPYC